MKIFLAIALLIMASCAPQQTAYIHVDKSKRTLTLLDALEKPIKQYRVALGTNPVGHKTTEGDGRTPEGLYSIIAHNPNSQYHKSIYISYPNAKDREQAKQRGVKPGGDIVIHGRGKGTGWQITKYTARGDWTLGCIAVTDQEMDEIYASVPDGTPILIEP